MIEIKFEENKIHFYNNTDTIYYIGQYATMTGKKLVVDDQAVTIQKDKDTTLNVMKCKKFFSIPIYKPVHILGTIDVGYSTWDIQDKKKMKKLMKTLPIKIGKHHAPVQWNNDVFHKTRKVK